MFFKKISKIDESLFKLAKRQKENIQIKKSETKQVHNNFEEIQRIIKLYLQKLQSTKLENVKEVNKFVIEIS